jgi:hypothetical protein
MTVSKDDAKKILSEYGGKYGIMEIGNVTAEPGVRINKNWTEFVLEGEK